jgi:hypothetical protein
MCDREAVSQCHILAADPNNATFGPEQQGRGNVAPRKGPLNPDTPAASGPMRAKNQSTLDGLCWAELCFAAPPPPRGIGVLRADDTSIQITDARPFFRRRRR